jgi:DNA polymerase-3 subunit gamma/tau
VIGQAAIARTLQRAVEQDRTAHAYLFCGTRGVGKTTMARIFARAMNVSDDLQDAELIAEAIMRGDDLDVIEIDGASNRGVQEARDLIAGAGLSPARCRSRIYIIDEVHMLTTESFNTLLKTMEEPPEHVKFILCTTEPHKVLATIQSRCQRFDFKPIPSKLIADHLRDIVTREGVEVEEAALSRVAELGNGSMRDALSVMDRLLAGGDASITLEEVEVTLGLPEAALINDVIDGIASCSAGDTLRSAEKLLAAGTSIDQALGSLIEYFRRMLIVSTCGIDTEVLDLSSEQREGIAERAAQFDPPSLVHSIAVCEAVARQGRLGASARAVFDAGLVRLALAGDLIDPSKLAAAPVMATPKRIAVESNETPTKKHAKPKPKSKRDKPAVSKKSVPAKPTPVLPVDGADSLETIWKQLVSSATSQAAKAAFEGIQAIKFDGDIVVIRSDGGAVPAMLLERIETKLSDAAGRRIRVQSDSPLDEGPPALSPQDAAGDPCVEMVKDLFDATVIQVRGGTNNKGESA